MNSRIKNRLYDTVQMIWVSTCITATLASTSFMGYQLYHYFVNIKPIKKEMEERFKEELLREGRMLRDSIE